MVNTPGMFLQMYGNHDYDWDFKTAPQKAANGAVHHWPRGKGLGGSSMINFMMYSHCSKSDLDIWRDLGNEGWAWDDIVPYFPRIERMHLPEDVTKTALSTEYVQPEMRGKEGMIHTSWQNNTFNWVQESWAKQSTAMGYPTATDPRTGTSLGFFNQLTTVDPKNHGRSYAANTYLAAAEGRKNLTIVTDSWVNKIIFDKSGSKPKAKGVEIEMGGRTFEVHAKKEVLVCMGTLQSPQLLELSGIGQREVLQKQDIEVVIENENVGENLQEHAMDLCSWQTKDGIPTAEHLRDDPSQLEPIMEAYAKDHSGPMAAAITTTGFLSIQNVAPKADLSALGKTGHHLPEKQVQLLMKQLNDPKEAVYQASSTPAGTDPHNRISNTSIFMHTHPGNHISLGLGLMHAFSRGHVHITSPNIKDHAEIDPKYLSHPMDIELLALGLLHMKDIIKTAPLADYVKDDPDHPGEKLLMENIPYFSTIEEAREMAKDRQCTEYHPTGTCAMFPEEEGGVVDNKLRVYGTEGLRVVDASVFPMNVQGNIMSLVYAVAEKAADLIKGEYAGAATNGTNGVH